MSDFASGAEFAMKVVDLNLHSFRRLVSAAQNQTQVSRETEERVFDARLAPDMLPFGRQVVLAAYFASAAADRLSGNEPPLPQDIPPKFEAAAMRLDEAIDKVRAARARSAEWCPEVVQSIAGETRILSKDAYLAEYALPSFMFHWVTAYGILRSRGYAIGKKDFLNVVAQV